MAGTICVLSGDTGRYPQFWEDFNKLLLPPETHTDVRYPGCGIARTRNAAVKNAKGDWLWFMDDDHAFPNDILLKLLERNVDVVAPLYLTRRSPFGPVMCGPRFSGSTKRPFYRLQPQMQGLREVDGIGTAGMLIRRHVWEAIQPLWFTLGQPEDGEQDGFAEDLSFCRRVKEQGFHIFADLDNPIGHRLGAIVTPHRMEDGSWVTKVTLGEAEFVIPPA